MWGKIINLTKSKGFQETVIMSGGNYVGTAISAIALILFSRFLGPVSFGLFSAGFALTLLVSRILDFGFNQAVQRHLAKEHADNSHNPIQAIAIIRFLTSIVIIVVGILSAPYISHNILKITDTRIVSYSLVFIGITLFFDYFLAIFQARHQYYLASLITILQAVIKFFGAIILYYTHNLTAASALLLYVLAPAIGILIGFKYLLKDIVVPIKNTLKDLKIIGKVAKWMSISIAAAAFAEHIDVLITQSYLNAESTGLFSAAARIAMFISLLGLSLGTVLSVRVAKYHDKKHLDSYLKKALLLSVGSGLAILLVIPFSSVAINFTVGAAYLNSIFPLTLLIIATAISTATMPYAALFYLFDKPQFYAYSGLLTTLVLIVADVWLIPTMGIVGAGYARIIMRLVGLIYTLWYARLAYKHHIS